MCAHIFDRPIGPLYRNPKCHASKYDIPECAMTGLFTCRHCKRQFCRHHHYHGKIQSGYQCSECGQRDRDTKRTHLARQQRNVVAFVIGCLSCIALLLLNQFPDLSFVCMILFFPFIMGVFYSKIKSCYLEHNSFW